MKMELSSQKIEYFFLTTNTAAMIVFTAHFPLLRNISRLNYCFDLSLIFSNTGPKAYSLPYLPFAEGKNQYIEGLSSCCFKKYLSLAILQKRGILIDFNLRKALFLRKC